MSDILAQERVMRELTSHKMNGLNEALTIKVLDEPGPGGACHDYLIFIGGSGVGNPGAAVDFPNHSIMFQKGPVQEGVNGISNEALLAIVEDRLLGFQSGEFRCRENALALTKLQEAMLWLQKRTRESMSRWQAGYDSGCHEGKREAIAEFKQRLRAAQDGEWVRVPDVLGFMDLPELDAEVNPTE